MDERERRERFTVEVRDGLRIVANNKLKQNGTLELGALMVIELLDGYERGVLAERRVALLKSVLRSCKNFAHNYQRVVEMVEGGLADAEALTVACDHNWVDIRNEVVLSGEMCTKCRAIR